MRNVALLVAVLAMPGTAWGQEATRAPFTGFHVGPEAGLHDHRLTLDMTDVETGDTISRSYDRTGFGVGAFAGYDLAVARRVRLGMELRASAGGGEGPRATFVNGATYEARPRYGFGAVARAGYVFGGDVMTYVTLGYGDYRYRQRMGVFIEGATDRVDGVTTGVGAEVRLNRRIGIRIDARRLFNRVDQLLVGLPVRF